MLFRDNNNCMASRSIDYDPSALDAYANDHAGQVYPPDQQCKESFGSEWVLNRVSTKISIINKQN